MARGMGSAATQACEDSLSPAAASVEAAGAAADRLSSAAHERVGAGGRRDVAELRRLATSEAQLLERLRESEAREEESRREGRELRQQLEELQRQLEQRQAVEVELLERVRMHQEAHRGLEDDLLKARAAQQKAEEANQRLEEGCLEASAARRKAEAELQEERTARLSTEALAKELQAKVEVFKQEMLGATDRRPKSISELPPGIEEQLDQMRQQLEAAVCAVKLQRETATPHGGSEGALHECTDAAPEEELESTEVQLMGEWVSVPSSWGPAVTDPPPSTGSALKCGGPSATSLESTGSGSTTSNPPAGPRRTPVKGPGGSHGSQRSPRSLEVAAELPAPAPGHDVTATPTRMRSQGEDILCSPGSDGAGMGLISMRDLCEIKALKKPPPPIRMLMEVCCLLFGIEPTKHLDERTAKGWRIDYWEPARRSLLSDPFFLSKLRTYDEELSPAQRAKIRKYFQDPEFTAARVRKCSKAAYELYVWVSRVMARQMDSCSPRKSASGPPVAASARSSASM
uniref:Uncharacterized protein n=1 Tax=Alexandrium catenella TaxID=2925 RepID=A0A7S1SII1_ALECA